MVYNSTDATVNNESQELDWMKDRQRNFTLCQILNTTATLIIVWILVCMAVYGKKAKKWQNTKPGRMFIAGFIALLFAVPPNALAITIPYIPYVKSGHSSCEELMDAFAVMGSMFMSATYLYLWYRQRLIYEDPCMQAIFGKVVNMLSWIALAFICVEAVGVSVGYAVPRTHIEQNNTCIYDPSLLTSKFALEWQKPRKYIVIVCLISSEAILLSLFIYPMIKIRKSRQVYQATNGSDEGDVMVSIIQRATICTAISVFSDILSFAIIRLLDWGNPALYSATMHNMNFLINAICIMLTFGVNTKILSVSCWTGER